MIKRNNDWKERIPNNEWLFYTSRTVMKESVAICFMTSKLKQTFATESAVLDVMPKVKFT